MQQACHKMEIGGVADRRLRLVRHQFDAVCLHHANIDRAEAGYSPDVILLPTGRNGSRAERILAVVGTLLRVALPFGLLMTG
jgi:hypothetical protein